MESYGETLLRQIKAILSGKKFNKEFYPLNDLVEMITYNKENVMRKIKIYKCLGFSTLIAIPLISAFISFLINFKKGIGLHNTYSLLKTLTEYLPWITLILTILTIINSILKPSERFSMACRIGIEIDLFKLKFLNGLEKIADGDEEGLSDFVVKQSEEFKSYQEKLIDLFLPQKT